MSSDLERSWRLLSHRTPRIVSDATGRVAGRLRLPAHVLPLSPRIRLGWFLTPLGEDAAAARLGEGRLELITTDQPQEFAFTLDAAAIARQHGAPLASLWIDLVKEGEFWFCQLAPGALRLDVVLPAPLLGSPFGMALLQHALEGLGQAALFDAIRRAEERHGIGRMLRERLLMPEGLLPASCPPRPPPVQAGGAEEIPPPDAAQAGSRLAAQLASALIAREPWPVMATADREYFQRSRIVHRRTGLPLTPAMLDAMALEDPAKLARALDNPDALRRWWLFDVVLPHPLPPEALPHEHRRHWLAPFIADPIAPANRFLIEAWERTHSGSAGITSLQDPAQRLAFQLAQILEVWRDHRRMILIGEDAIGFWSQHIPVGDRLFSLFTLLCGMAMAEEDPMPAEAVPASLIRRCESAITLIETHCPTLGPLLGRSRPRRAAAAEQHPVYLIGHRRLPGSAGGLRMTGAALRRLGIAARLFDAEEGRPLALTEGGRLRPWTAGAADSHRAAEAPRPQGLGRPLSLFFGQAARFLKMIRSSEFSGIAARRRIGIFPWAFADVPAQQAAGAREADAIWAPSSFVRDAFARATNRPVTLIGHALDLPEDLPDPYPELLPDRAGTFVFHSAFHPASGLRRSNPSAVVTGFLQAFPRGREPVALVLRAPEGGPDEASDPYGEWPMIQEAAARDPRIILLEENSGPERALALIRHADCVVSAHRSQAFGVLCAEAHYYGVPLIATGYSGNMDYCDEDNTWLVEYRLRDIQPGEHPIDIHSQWADCRVDHLAAQMQAVIAQRELALAMAARGQALVRARYAPARFDAALRQALELA
ncbi:MAG: hypothetical protein RMK64_11095 [Rhodovarius sp.]|nr:hypothetical protein [Rhodovarius sp.]